LLTHHLVDVYDVTPEEAARLLQHELILPVLEGLDEMDALRSDGTPDPDAPRARAALKALNNYTQGRDPGPLVLTCRTSHYDALPRSARLSDAARVTIDPVDTAQAVGYLRDRTGDLSRWRPLVDHLRTHPTGPLAEALSTPWRLCLTATVYRDSGDPAELLHRLPVDDLDRHLLARYIPAVTEFPGTPARYVPDKVHVWLHQLARHLDDDSASRHAGDLVLHHLWPLAGPGRVRRVDGLLSGATVLLALPLAWATPRPLLNAALVGGSAVVFGLRAVRAPAPPRRLAGFHAGWRTLLVALVAGVMAAGFTPVTAGALAAVTAGCVFGLAAWVVAGVGAGGPTLGSSPRSIVRDDMVVGLFTGLAPGVVVGSSVGIGAGPAVGLVIGSTLALAVFTTADSARRYGVFLLCARGRLPFDLAGFLDWAVTAGLLRYSGPAYQFRHRELQQWSASHPLP
jgi:hypothetical protein